MDRNSTPEDLEDEQHYLLFAAQRSQRYHNHRVRFFERFARTLTFLNLALGASTVAALLKTWPTVAMYTAAAIAIFSALDLVVGFGPRARIHRDLMRRFNFLEQNLRAAKPYTEELHKDLFRERLNIEADEPPKLRNLDMLCHNELVLAGGYDSQQEVPIPGYKALVADWFDVGSRSLRKKIDHD